MSAGWVRAAAEGKVGDVTETDEIEWLGTKKAARYLGITDPTLYRLVDAGQVVGYKIGRVLRFKRDDLDAFLEGSRVQPGELRHLYAEAKNDTSETAASET